MKLLSLLHRPSLALACAFLTLTVFGCGDETSFALEEKPAIETTPSEVVFQPGATDIGGEIYKKLDIRNTGQGVLEIHSVTLEYQPASSEEGTRPALFLQATPPAGTRIAPKDKAEELGLPDTGLVEIGFRRYDDSHERSATLVIESNDSQTSTLRINVKVATTTVNLIAAPSEVVFQAVQKNKFADRTVSLLNTGDATIDIVQVRLTGDATFGLLVDPNSEADPQRPGPPFELDPPIQIGPAGSYTMAVRFMPDSELPQSGSIYVATGADSGSEDLQIPLKGNHRGPCIRVEPPTVNFGAKLVQKPAALPVHIESCGEAALEIHGIKLVEDGSPDYDLDTTSFTVESSDIAWPTTAAPKAVPVNGTAHFDVIYTPDVESPKDTQGHLIPDKTKVLIDTNTFEGTVEVEVEGFGTLTPCPTAVITLLEGGSEVAPQTKLMLSAENSLPNQGTISQYKWEVTQPKGAASVFHPSATAPKVQFEVNVAGRYTFKLQVKDAEAWSCVPATREIVVIPDEAIHVELIWETPNDEDPTDEGQGAGSDMDLHFVHLNNALQNPHGEDLYPPVHGDGVPEGYFDDLWDTFWFYVTHDWGQISIGDDDPSLDRDDVDGAGPENLNLNVPEPGVTYKVGVHYWNDHGFGMSTPTVYIFIFGEKKHGPTGCPMVRYDMWEVGTIAWPSQQVEIWTCNGQVPPAEGSPWPERPCGSDINKLEDGSACKQVLMRDYEPEKFVFDF